MLTLNSQGKTLHSTKPLIMGILNVTPDSFYQKSRVTAVSEAIDLAGEMLADGASIIDIGGNCGLFSIFSRMHFPQSNIHCYEPNLFLNKYLKKN